MTEVIPGIVLCGATGRTGNAVAHALAARGDVWLVACVGPSVATTPTRQLPDDVIAAATLDEVFEQTDGPDVLVEFSPPDAALANLQVALDNGLHAVVGTTGFVSGQLESIGKRYEAEGRSLLHVPNFSVGAVLAMRIAADLARHFPDVEVVETHHDGKRDSPSGTAIRTAQLIAEARREAGFAAGRVAAAGESHARGEVVDGVPVHALRLPGATAHQEVVFGAPGELLTIRHDAIDRGCYANGVAIAARRVQEFRGLNTGLEHVL